MKNSIRLTDNQFTDYEDACRQKDGTPYELYRPWKENGFTRLECQNGIRLKRIRRPLRLCALSGCSLYSGRGTLCIMSGSLISGICTVFSYAEGNRTVSELYCLVHPDFRRKGIGTALVEKAARLVSGKTSRSASIYLVGSDTVFASHMKSRYSHSEYFMIRHAQTGVSADILPCPEAFFSESPDNGACGDSAYPSALVLKICLGEETVCQCRADIFDRYVNISQVYTAENCRGQGFAPALMCRAASRFPGKDLLLQVSGGNTAAIHAYEKSGFTLLRSIDYFRKQIK